MFEIHLFISNRYPGKCFSNSEFENISHDILRIILQTCKLTNVQSANAAWKWAEASCKRNMREVNVDNQKEELEDLFHLLNLEDKEERVEKSPQELLMVDLEACEVI